MDKKAFLDVLSEELVAVGERLEASWEKE